MKKLVVAAVMAVLAAASVFAQDGRNIYNKYAGKEGVESVYISPAMFKMMGQVQVVVDENGDEVDISPIIRSLDGMYIIDSSNSEVNSRMAGDVADFVQKNKFELLMDVKDGEETVSMFTGSDKKEADLLNGFLMLVSEPDECTFIYIAGTMSRSDFEKLVNSAVKE